MIHFIFPVSKIRPPQIVHLLHPLQQHQFQCDQMLKNEEITHNIRPVIHGYRAFPSPTSGPGQHLKSAAVLLRQRVSVYLSKASKGGKRFQ